MSQIALAGRAPLVDAAVTEAEFADLVRENQSMVFSIAYHFLHDTSLAEELAQDVFLQLYKNLDKLESRHHASNWLRRVASHRCIDYGRKKGKAAEVGFENIPEPSSEPEAPDPLLRDHLRKLVASLPEKKRMLVILRYQEEMEMEEIGRVLDMPARTVRTQLWRTMAHLREKAEHLIGHPVKTEGDARDESLR